MRYTLARPVENARHSQGILFILTLPPLPGCWLSSSCVYRKCILTRRHVFAAKEKLCFRGGVNRYILAHTQRKKNFLTSDSFHFPSLGCHYMYNTNTRRVAWSLIPRRAVCHTRNCDEPRIYAPLVGAKGR